MTVEIHRTQAAVTVETTSSGLPFIRLAAGGGALPEVTLDLRPDEAQRLAEILWVLAHRVRVPDQPRSH